MIFWNQSKHPSSLAMAPYYQFFSIIIWIFFQEQLLPVTPERNTLFVCLFIILYFYIKNLRTLSAFFVSGHNFIFNLFLRCQLVTVYHVLPWVLLPANSLTPTESIALSSYWVTQFIKAYQCQCKLRWLDSWMKQKQEVF